jgi:ankyrin repeat protein
VNAADAAGRTALLEAAWNGNADIVKYLLEQGAAPDAADKSGFTPIMRGAEGGYLPVVNALVAKGADVNCRGRVRGTTPLMLAAEHGHTKVISALLAAGAEVNAADRYEETALTLAYGAEQAKAAQLLESKGGHGKPERSGYSNSDREPRTATRAPLPPWTAGGTQDGVDDETGGGY